MRTKKPPVSGSVAAYIIIPLTFSTSGMAAMRWPMRSSMALKLVSAISACRMTICASAPKTISCISAAPPRGAPHAYLARPFAAGHQLGVHHPHAADDQGQARQAPGVTLDDVIEHLPVGAGIRPADFQVRPDPLGAGLEAIAQSRVGQLDVEQAHLPRLAQQRLRVRQECHGAAVFEGVPGLVDADDAEDLVVQ